MKICSYFCFLLFIWKQAKHNIDLCELGLSEENCKKIYYIVNVDRNTIKLASTYFNSIQDKPEIVSITSTSNGTINPINPSIDLYKDSTVEFDDA